MPSDAAKFPQPKFLKLGAAERLFGQALVALVRVGLVRGHFYVLEVRGRKTGRVISLPVDPIEIGGKRYLVCARGEFELGAQRPHGWRGRAHARNAAATVCGARAAVGVAAADP